MKLIYLGIDLISDFGLDLTGITGEQSQETLSSRVDDIDLVKSDGVCHFFPLLELTLRTLDDE